MILKIVFSLLNLFMMSLAELLKNWKPNFAPTCHVFLMNNLLNFLFLFLYKVSKFFQNFNKQISKLISFSSNLNFSFLKKLLTLQHVFLILHDFHKCFLLYIVFQIFSLFCFSSSELKCLFLQDIRTIPQMRIIPPPRTFYSGFYHKFI